jgi:hypothetical protein
MHSLPILMHARRVVADVVTEVQAGERPFAGSAET